MPSTTAKQKRTMGACAHGAKLAACQKIPKHVAVEFNEADKRMSTAKHGYFKATKSRS